MRWRRREECEEGLRGECEVGLWRRWVKVWWLGVGVSAWCDWMGKDGWMWAYHLLSALIPSGIETSMAVSFGLRNDCSMSLR